MIPCDANSSFSLWSTLNSSLLPPRLLDWLLSGISPWTTDSRPVPIWRFDELPCGWSLTYDGRMAGLILLTVTPSSSYFYLLSCLDKYGGYPGSSYSLDSY